MNAQDILALPKTLRSALAQRLARDWRNVNLRMPDGQVVAWCLVPNRDGTLVAPALDPLLGANVTDGGWCLGCDSEVCEHVAVWQADRDHEENTGRTA